MCLYTGSGEPDEIWVLENTLKQVLLVGVSQPWGSGAGV